jgi:NhaP-type Na+/H+ or K+/H+ antiporter
MVSIELGIDFGKDLISIVVFVIVGCMVLQLLSLPLMARYLRKSSKSQNLEVIPGSTNYPLKNEPTIVCCEPEDSTMKT